MSTLLNQYHISKRVRGVKKAKKVLDIVCELPPSWYVSPFVAASMLNVTIFSSSIYTSSWPFTLGESILKLKKAVIPQNTNRDTEIKRTHIGPSKMCLRSKQQISAHAYIMVGDLEDKDWKGKCF